MLEKPKVDALKGEGPAVAPPQPDEREWWRKQLGRPIELTKPTPALHLTGVAGR